MKASAVDKEQRTWTFNNRVFEKLPSCEFWCIFKPHTPLKAAYLSHGAVIIIVLIIVIVIVIMNGWRRESPLTTWGGGWWSFFCLGFFFFFFCFCFMPFGFQTLVQKNFFAQKSFFTFFFLSFFLSFISGCFFTDWARKWGGGGLHKHFHFLAAMFFWNVDLVAQARRRWWAPLFWKEIFVQRELQNFLHLFASP